MATSTDVKASTVGLEKTVFTLESLMDAVAFDDIKNAIEWYTADVVAMVCCSKFKELIVVAPGSPSKVSK